ncbi:MAG: ABC transporter substrate-binding protein [Pseudomonadota bacterium]
MRHAIGMIGAAVGLALAAGGAAAQDKEPIRFGMCYDLSKSYTFISPQVVQAARDLATLTNMDGGIAGHPVELVVQDHGNEPQRGIECYERLKREGVFIFDMLSTPVSIAVLPRIMKDKNILLQSLVGRGDAVNGEVFTQVFPVGPTYWGQAANDVAYAKQELGGDLSDAKIAFVYVDYPFGQEPIEILETLAEREGFELGLFPYPLPGTDQSSTWTQVRRFQPDYIISWSLAGMHVVASREMQRNGIPMEKYISVNWLNEVDIENLGPQKAAGIKRGTNVAGGQDIPIIQRILDEVYGAGEGAGPDEQMKDVYYNTGVAIYSVAFEGARLALEEHGAPLTPEKMKKGMESIENFDANGLMAPVTVTEDDHGGGGKTRVEMWDGEQWVPQTDWIAAYQDVVWEVVNENSEKFAAENE